MNNEQPPFSYGFPMVFLWFSYSFPHEIPTKKTLQNTRAKSTQAVALAEDAANICRSLGDRRPLGVHALYPLVTIGNP